MFHTLKIFFVHGTCDNICLITNCWNKDISQYSETRKTENNNMHFTFNHHIHIIKLRTGCFGIKWIFLMVSWMNNIYNQGSVKCECLEIYNKEKKIQTNLNKLFIHISNNKLINSILQYLYYIPIFGYIF